MSVLRAAVTFDTASGFPSKMLSCLSHTCLLCQTWLPRVSVPIITLPYKGFPP